MCGISGFLEPQGSRSLDDLTAIASTMADTLLTRGPDSSGVWANAEAGIALSHRRLAIVDLSPSGHQPMSSACGRYVISYNGEVYNFMSLRRELEAAGVLFHGHNDTEVIVNGCAHWGVRALTERLNGMFAFALWDTHTRTLSLVRDRLGIKPLFWGRLEGATLFASELKALRRHPAFVAEVDRDALALFLRHNYVPAPMSIFKGVSKLPPGAILTIAPGRPPDLAIYWDARAMAASGRANPLMYSPEEAVNELESVLRSAIQSRMVADVPLGAFLSGGIDSSLVVSLMQAQSSRPVRTFSIGFHVPGYNEATHAKAVASHLGTDHTELYVRPEEALAIVPNLAGWFDEPFADASQIPTFLVCEMARRHVTVALSGDGGDELFSGYSRYARTRQRWRTLDRPPRWLKNSAAFGLGALPQDALHRLFMGLPGGVIPQGSAAKIGRLAQLLRYDSPDALYRDEMSHWKDPLALTGGTLEPDTAFNDPTFPGQMPDITDRMRLIDSVTYLPDDILTKVDRASMAVSLEARVPLLDHRVFELAWAMPRAHLEREGLSKWPLRQVLYRHVPRQLIDRPKMGFSVPIDHWLRGPLRPWAEELLSVKALEAGGYLRAAPIRMAWAHHLSGRRANHALLWTVLMFQAWRQDWLDTV